MKSNSMCQSTARVDQHQSLRHVEFRIRLGRRNVARIHRRSEIVHSTAFVVDAGRSLGRPLGCFSQRVLGKSITYWHNKYVFPLIQR
jgi:hypothetical protein